jgi:hypothetical protein
MGDRHHHHHRHDHDHDDGEGEGIPLGISRRTLLSILVVPIASCSGREVCGASVRDAAVQGADLDRYGVSQTRTSRHAIRREGKVEMVEGTGAERR